VRRGSGGGGCGGVGIGAWVLGPRAVRAAPGSTGTATASSAWRNRLATSRGSAFGCSPSPPRTVLRRIRRPTFALAVWLASLWARSRCALFGPIGFEGSTGPD
jgi:hypothetical protein